MTVIKRRPVVVARQGPLPDNHQRNPIAFHGTTCHDEAVECFYHFGENNQSFRSHFMSEHDGKIKSRAILVNVSDSSFN